MLTDTSQHCQLSIFCQVYSVIISSNKIASRAYSRIEELLSMYTTRHLHADNSLMYTRNDGNSFSGVKSVKLWRRMNLFIVCNKMLLWIRVARVFKTSTCTMQHLLESFIFYFECCFGNSQNSKIFVRVIWLQMYSF